MESFLDLERNIMEAIVSEMNKDGGYEIENHNKKKEEHEDPMIPTETALSVEDVLAMIEEMTMLH